MTWHPRMQCLHPGCENDGRYVSSYDGFARCGIHDIDHPHASIRTSDIPLLITKLLTILWGCDPSDEYVANEMRAVFSMIAKPGVTAPLQFDYPKPRADPQERDAARMLAIRIAEWIQAFDPDGAKGMTAYTALELAAEQIRTGEWNKR